MKKITLFILFLISFNIYSQSAIVSYKYLYKAPANQKKENINNFDKGIGIIAQNHKYVLKFNPEESYYQVIKAMKPDDIDQMTYDLSERMFRGGIFYQNKKHKYILNKKTTYSGEKYIVKDTLTNDWIITQDSKYIGKYKCFKAYKKIYKDQIITAWFTPEIPLPFGPVGYGGLPGLILELNYLNNHLLLQKITFKNQKIAITKPTEGSAVTAKEYNNLQFKRRLQLYQKAQRRHR